MFQHGRHTCDGMLRYLAERMRLCEMHCGPPSHQSVWHRTYMLLVQGHFCMELQAADGAAGRKSLKCKQAFAVHVQAPFL